MGGRPLLYRCWCCARPSLFLTSIARRSRHARYPESLLVGCPVHVDWSCGQRQQCGPEEGGSQAQSQQSCDSCGKRGYASSSFSACCQDASFDLCCGLGLDHGGNCCRSCQQDNDGDHHSCRFCACSSDNDYCGNCLRCVHSSQGDRPGASFNRSSNDSYGPRCGCGPCGSRRGCYSRCSRRGRCSSRSRRPPACTWNFDGAHDCCGW